MKVMKKDGIDDLNPEEGGVTEHLLDEVENPNKIDWKAVRHDIEQEISNMPDVLPAELAAFQEIMEGKKSLPSLPSIAPKMPLPVESPFLSEFGCNRGNTLWNLWTLWTNLTADMEPGGRCTTT